MMKQSSDKKKPFVLFDIDYTLFNTDLLKASNLQEFVLYDEVEKVLEKLAPYATLGIFSEGDVLFQKKKLTVTAIDTYFEKGHMHIDVAKDTMIHIFKQYQDHAIFLIDDKLPILYTVKQHYPFVSALWIKRGKYALAQKPMKNFVPDAIIENLQDVIPVITAPQKK
jgi:hypothetical protein